MMITQQQQRLLRFPCAEAASRAVRVVVLRQIAGGGVVIDRLQEHRVLRRPLLFELQGKRQLVLVVVRALPIFRTVQGVERVTEVAHLTIVRA